MTRSQVMPNIANQGDGTEPERGGGRALFVVEDLGVDDPAAVIERAVEVAVAGVAMPAAGVGAPTMDTPATTSGDPREFLHIDVDQLAGPFPLITPDLRSVGGPITSIETTAPRGAQDRAHRRRRHPELMSDVIGTPTTLLDADATPDGAPTVESDSVTDAAATTDRTGRRRLRRGTGHATSAPSSRRPGTVPRSPRSSTHHRGHTTPSVDDPPASTARSDAGF